LDRQNTTPLFAKDKTLVKPSQEPMMVRKRKLGRIEKLKQVAKREARALFAAVAIFVGVSAFLWILGSSWEGMPVEWWRLALAATFLTLPEVCAKLQEANEPYVILFALAFRDGFFYLPFTGPGLAKWAAQARKLWEIIRHK
jgi:hypothetical protein